MEQLFIAVIGSRTFFNLSKMNEVLDRIIDKYKVSNIFIVSGGAKGADNMAQNYARTNGYPIIIYYPDYEREGRGAPLVRNEKIIKQANIVVAFKNGESNGTNHALSIADSLDKLTYTYDNLKDELTSNNKKGGVFND